MIKSQLQSKLLSQQACIGVIGLGYVGLPVVLRYTQKGFKVLGFDTDDQKVEALNAGRSYIRHISDAGWRGNPDGHRHLACFHAKTIPS